MDLGNPFKNAKIQHWPDYWIVICGLCLLIALGGVATGSVVVWLPLLFGGLLLFGFGAKIAHYRERDKSLSSNVWVSKWRHGFLADLFALLGIGSVVLACIQMWLTEEGLRSSRRQASIYR